MSAFSFPPPTTTSEVVAKLDNKPYKDTGLYLDPITNREISKSCWNGSHEEQEFIGLECVAAVCRCYCHEHNPIN